MTTETAVLQGVFEADPVHSSLGFAVRHLGLSVFRGSFGEVSARLAPGSDGRLALEGSTPVESISITQPQEFRAHVLGEEFFKAERHPEIEFRSSELQLDPSGSAALRGALTIAGVTHDVEARGTWSAPAEDPFGSIRAALTLDTTIDRRDFGLAWQLELPSGGDALGHEVTLSIELELIQSTG